MSTMIFYFISFQIVQSNSELIDLNVCKLTHTGTEYTGKLSKTETNVTCQFWHSATQKGSELLVDEAFSDGSKVLAKNYCRNPNNNPNGPWCYTTQPKLIFDFCNVPLCKSQECRVSGPGMEYTGLVQKSSSGKKCTQWKEKHMLKEKHKEKPFKNEFFSDGSANNAGRKCRNPDGNISGPWCYVEKDDSDLHDKELCDVPFCDDLGNIMYSEGSDSGQYYFYSSINETQSFNISFRLWNPADWLRGQVFLLLSAYDISAHREAIERWNSAVEVMFSHTGSGVLSKEDEIVKSTPFILSGAKWTELEITWINVDNASLLVKVFEKPKTKPIAITEIFIHDTIFEMESFRFFSIGGSPTLWNVPSDDEECFVHTVPQMNFTRFWLIKRTTLGMDIEIFVRAKKEATILLRTAPMNATDQIQITIGDKDKVKIYTYINSNQSRQLMEVTWPNILDFWKWEYFKVALFKDKLQLFWVRQVSTELVIEVSHRNIEKLMWVSFASPKISYWTIYCDPRGTIEPPSASPPECVTQEADLFNGTLSVTKEGNQCIPWTDKSSIPEKYHNDELFQSFGGKTTCQNFCRNLDNDPKGAYCIVRSPKSDTEFDIEYCHPRACGLGDCKLAGTANDYIGQLNLTRSKRACKTWIQVPDEIVNVDNFPDPTLQDAGNFCRNPSKSVAGSWCFTRDPEVPRDLCFIKDCDKPLECTILTSGYVERTVMYIFPLWRKHGLKFWLKAWNPDIYEGLVISMLSLDFSREYKLLIGDEDNEKVKLFYKESGKEILLLQKTLPHLIPTGKWGGYRLRPGKGKIELSYAEVTNSFFEWVSTKEDLSFEPIFINFGTIQNHWIGINFQCTECLVVQTSVMNESKMYPINLWRDEGVTSKLELNLRGTGYAFITLMWTPDFEKYLAIQISSNENNIVIVRYTKKNDLEPLADIPVSAALSEQEWSKYIISFTEDSLTIHKDSVHLLEWPSPFPLLFYWFSVSAEKGTITWSANCPAADIDGEPRNGNWGKWGPWSCSVTCGKGEGRIERTCDDPPPNVFGNECKGLSVYEGPCNDFPCGEISPDTINRIRQYLSSHHKSLEVDLSERVVLPCNSQAISLITSEVSDVNISWTHNGFPYSRTKFHLDENYSLVIPRAQEKHNGIYLCMAYQDPDSIPSKLVLEVVSLVVIKPKPTKKVRKGRSLTLKCNGLALSYVYTDLSQRWELNGTIWKDYGLGTLQAFTVDKLENITDSHTGLWTCVVIQEDFKFKWTTNWVYLKDERIFAQLIKTIPHCYFIVKSAPSFWSHLMEDVSTAPIFGKLENERLVMILFFSIIGGLLALIIVTTVLLVKWLKN